MDNNSSQDKKNPKQRSAFINFWLKSWQPVPTWDSTIRLFCVLGVLLLIMGGLLTWVNSTIPEIKIPYSFTDKGVCKDQDVCDVKFKIDTEIESPVLVYYEIENFYQNHRRYLNSKSSYQLAGKSTYSSDLCEPMVTNHNMSKKTSFEGGHKLEPNDVAVPCGLIAYTLFDDTFEVWDDKSNNKTIDDTNIAWPSDRQEKFKNSAKPEKQWHNMEDEHFIVWMRTAGSSDFRKLWGRINENLPAGEYHLKIPQNNFNTTKFAGSKSVVLTKTGFFGGKNTMMANAYLIGGGICLIIVGFFYKKKNA